MQIGRLNGPGSSGRAAVGRVVAVAMAAGMATMIVGVRCGAAGATVPHGEPPAASASPLTLARAPAGLRAVVRRTLGFPSVASGSVFQRAELTASAGHSGDQFGYSVAISGSTAVIGAPHQNNDTGAAYVFVRLGKVWSQQAKLTASDGADGDQFGYSVAIAGSTAVVGAAEEGSTIGAAYVYVRSGATWSQQAKLTAPQWPFRRPVRLLGGRLWVHGGGRRPVE